MKPNSFEERERSWKKEHVRFDSNFEEEDERTCVDSGVHVLKLRQKRTWEDWVPI